MTQPTVTRRPVVDPLAKSAIEVIHRAALEQDAFLLIDGAIDATIRARVIALVPDELRLAVFEGHAAAGIDALALSPCLIDLCGFRQRRSEPVLNALLQLTSGLPVLHLLNSSLALDALRDHLRTYATAQCGDSTFALRFADTRVLPALADALDEPQRTAFFGATAQWLVVGRRGVLEPLRFTPHTAPAAPLALSDAQFIRILDASEPDWIIEHLRGAGSLPDELAPSLAFAAVRELLGQATKCGVLDDPDRVVWCSAGLRARSDPARSKRWENGIHRVAINEMTSGELVEMTLAEPHDAR